MAVVGKELEPKINPDELAGREVDGYIEKIEKRTETRTVTQSLPTQPTSTASNTDDAAKKAMSVGPKKQKQQIILPMDEEEIKQGLHHKVFDAIRWLAEWSVYMIKKYPGRVFYKNKA